MTGLNKAPHALAKTNQACTGSAQPVWTGALCVLGTVTPADAGSALPTCFGQVVGCAESCQARSYDHDISLHLLACPQPGVPGLQLVLAPYRWLHALQPGQVTCAQQCRDACRELLTSWASVQ